MTTSNPVNGTKTPEELKGATVRFAGDSGDGMQLSGTQFTNSSAVFGNDISTLPDFPAEIRAPAGTVYGVSGYQLQFSSSSIHTPGDKVDALVAMNPAALQVNLKDLKMGGIIIVNEDGFTDQNLKLAKYDKNPLNDGSLADYKVHPVPMTKLTRKACEEFGLFGKDADRCKNFFALGIVCWLYSRPLEPIMEFLNQKFAKKESVRDANIKVLKAGYFLGETEELFSVNYRVRKAKLPPGKYREIHGNQALALGLIAAGQLAKKSIFYGSYPITPASDILHELAKHKNFGVKTFQAEDEMAAIAAAIGASFGGALGVTASSGPGIALKGEAMGLAVMLELPLVIINVQRGGPSTGLPTKVEQSDLSQAMYGRNGECPVAIVAPQSASDCFEMALMAVRISAKFMTPVIFLSDGFIANSAEPWKIPDVNTFATIDIDHPHEANGEDGVYLPYLRDENLSRPWALPGTPGLMHRLGGLEKADVTGAVSYDPDNHQHMVDTRKKKIANIAKILPPLEIYNEPEDGSPADVLLVGWGSSYGPIKEAVNSLSTMGRKVSSIHIRYLNPFPPNLEEILERHRDKQILVPELNTGQLRQILRSEFLVDAKGLNKVKGRPFMVGEIIAAVEDYLTKETANA